MTPGCVVGVVVGAGGAGAAGGGVVGGAVDAVRVVNVAPATGAPAPADSGAGDDPPVGALAGTLELAGGLTAGTVDDLAGGGKKGTVEREAGGALASGAIAGPVPTATTEAATHIAAPTALKDTMTRLCNKCAFMAPNVVSAATPAAPAAATADADAAFSAAGCPNSGDAKTSSNVALSWASAHSADMALPFISSAGCPYARNLPEA
jgi:hypothetical protein